MSICLVCGSEIPENRSNCPCCGEYPVRIIGDNTRDTQYRLKQHAEEKRNQKLKDISIALHGFRLDGEELSSQEIKIGTAAELYHHEIWLQETFAPACGLPSLDIECTIYRADASQKVQCSIAAPTGDELLYIGAVLEDGFQLHLLMKNDREIVRSQPISILQ